MLINARYVVISINEYYYLSLTVVAKTPNYWKEPKRPSERAVKRLVVRLISIWHAIENMHNSIL